MALLQEASLIVTANAQKAGKLYSIIPQSGAGDFDVTRATSATRVDSQGLIEIPRTNLLTFSEQIDNAIWTKTNVNITQNAGIAPDGTNTADLVVPNTTNGEHNVANSSVPLSPVTNFETYSIYAKSSGYTFLGIRINVSSTWVVSFFNLSNGTVVSSGANFSNTRIENVGNGWYRCSVTYQNRTANGIQTIPSNNGSSVTFSGNDVDGILLWGAQLETSVSPTIYIPTTSIVRTRFQGITQDGSTASNIPRLDYTNASCPSILIEPQRTNSLTWSEDFGNAAWAKTGVAINENVSASPTGMSSADRMTGNGVSGEHRVAVSNASFTSGLTYTLSFFVKKDTNDFVQITLNAIAFGSTSFANFNINTGSIGFVGAGTNASIQNYGNGWYRCSITAISTNTISSFILLNLVTGANSVRLESNTLSTSVFIWGAQLEVGSNATSYIPTLSTSMTRNLDFISKGGISSLIGQLEGTIYLNLNILPSSSANLQVFRIDDLSDNNRIRIITTSTQRLRFICQLNGNIVQYDFTTIDAYTSLTSLKMAFAYKSGDIAIYINGIQANTSSNVLTFSDTLSRVQLSSLVTFGVLQQFTSMFCLFPTRLTNTQLQQLTTP